VAQTQQESSFTIKGMGTFKSFIEAKVTLAGIEVMNMLRKRQSYTGSLFSGNIFDDFYELTRQ